MDKPTSNGEMFHIEKASKETVSSHIIEKFIEKLGVIVTGPMIEKEDAFIIPVDPAIFMNYNELQRIRFEVVNPVVERLSLKPFFSLYCGEPYGFKISKLPIEPFKISTKKSTRVETDTCHANLSPTFPSTNPQDVAKLRHINRLKVAFNNISQEEISESVKFLIEKCGWTNADFQNTMPKPISPITIYRYKKDKFKQHKKTEP